MIKINIVPLMVSVWRFIKKHILRRKLTPQRNFGLKRDKPDKRDVFYHAKRTFAELPSSTYMKNINSFPWRYEQGIIGSCVGHGVVEAFRKVLQVNSMSDFDGSRLYAYYNARENEDKEKDAGASIRDGIKALNTYGLCKESTWPYIVSKFAIKPPDEAYMEGLQHQALVYQRIYPVTKEAIMDALYNGFPVIYGKILYESFMSSTVEASGIVPTPKRCEDEVGGHCMVAFDYDEEGTIELNTWGEHWGFNRGCAKIPWKYILNSKKCFDFWVLYLTE